MPVLMCDPKTDWTNYGMHPFSREDYLMGMRFAEANGSDSFRLFAIARLACIPFSVLGGYVCYRWAAELWGSSAGFLALVLWCFNPSILGHGPLVMPDVPAAATGVAAYYLFWKWLKCSSWSLSLLSGGALGLAELCKTTFVIFFLISPTIWCHKKVAERESPAKSFCRRQTGMIALILALGIYVVNLGYGFAGSFQRLGDFRFQSRLLNGLSPGDALASGNRFANTLFASVPVPLPKDYVQGIDRQRTDFELGGRSYLRGNWQMRGWWYYHLYALAVKTPLGVLLVLSSGVFVSLFRQGYLSSFSDELCLLLPASAIIGLVSFQTGFSNHMRYTIPALPFLFIWMSRAARAIDFRHWGVMLATIGGTSWATISSLSVYPHSISYFNELVGGPKNGHLHLLDSNVAWGQDLLNLRRWLDSHPEAQPLYLAAFGWIDPRLAGIEFSLPPIGPDRPGTRREAVSDGRLGPKPGWYAIDVNFLHGTHWPAPNGQGGWREIATQGQNYEYFQRFEPTDRVAYSYHVYHITLRDANRVRRDLGLPLLTDDSEPKQATEVHL